MYTAFQYGAPPHGGCAFGLDRLVQIMLDEPNLRQVVIFPTNQRGQDLMLGAPTNVTEQQLRDVLILWPALWTLRNLLLAILSSQTTESVCGILLCQIHCYPGIKVLSPLP